VLIKYYFIGFIKYFTWWDSKLPYNRPMTNSQSLPTTTGSGAQATTDTPQNVAQTSSFGGNQTNTVQTGIASSVLSTQAGGIPLKNTPLVAYDLNQAIPGTTTETSQPAHAQPNHALLGVSALLLVVAVVLFWTTKKAKNTTE
jgi:hypothetical protein